MNRNRPFDKDADERELQFDVRRLDAGDAVEVFVEEERRWVRGKFIVSSSGAAVVQLVSKPPLQFEAALAMGIKRVLH
jgi:hypothetical protein